MSHGFEVFVLFKFLVLLAMEIKSEAIEARCDKYSESRNCDGAETYEGPWTSVLVCMLYACTRSQVQQPCDRSQLVLGKVFLSSELLEIAARANPNTQPKPPHRVVDGNVALWQNDCSMNLSCVPQKNM